jgi:protein-S-isoprenylcysteine O-methyltransferase Ste14
MPGDRPFQIALCVLFSGFTVIRIHYRRAAARQPSVRGNHMPDASILRALIPYEVFTFFVYLFAGQWLAWAALPFPVGLRWVGAGLGAIALLLFVWVHRSLGPNFSQFLRLREGHTLVTNGPYRWVRHPMYVAFYLLHLAVFLLSANGFIGLTWIGGLTCLMAVRLRREEALLAAEFGTSYADYVRHTGRFLPRLHTRSLGSLWQRLFLPSDGRRVRPRDEPS